MSSTIRGDDNFDSKDVNVGAAKAWVNFNGTGVVAIRSSFNVSSVTDNGVGNYTLNFAQSMADTNYSTTNTANSSGGGDSAGLSVSAASFYTVNSVQIFNGNTSGALFDPFSFSCTVHGN